MGNRLKNNKRFYKYIGIAFFLIAIIAIGMNINMNKEGENIDKENEFAIYLLGSPPKNNRLDVESLNNLSLSESPIITEKEIAKYYWDDQIIELKKEVSSEELETEKMAKFGMKKFNHEGSYFVVIVKGEPIYWGQFLSVFSSWCPSDYPSITVLENEKNTILFLSSHGEILDKKIKDNRVYKIFKKNGKLQRGSRSSDLSFSYYDIARVTSSNIREIKKGMTYEDIITKLGKTRDIGSGAYVMQYIVDDSMIFSIPFGNFKDICPLTGEELLEKTTPIQ